MSKTVLIIGATSGIAMATAYEFAQHGYDLVLAARDVRDIGRTASDITLRHGVRVFTRPFSALDYDSHPTFFASCHGEEIGALEGMIVCHGYLGEQARAQADFAEAQSIIDLNYTSYVSVVHTGAAYFEEQRQGFICALGSVAGDRGRQSNYVYGSAKGAITLFMQGLQNRLYRSGVRVITIKPGFVDTAMTYGLLKGGPLVASPSQAALAIYRAISSGKGIAYVPWFWRWIMLIIRWIPDTIFKRLRL